MTIKTIVTCDKCSKQWEARGVLGSFHAPGYEQSNINLCEPCSILYKDLLKKLDKQRIQTIKKFLRS